MKKMFLTCMAFIMISITGCKKAVSKMYNLSETDEINYSVDTISDPASDSTKHENRAILYDNGSRWIISPSKDTLFINSVKGHDEKDTIIGNFTGNGIDTLFVKRIVDCKCSLDKNYNQEKHLSHELDDELVKYYMVSTNPSLGQMELFGYATLSPRLVNEGDLDGNGTCDVGYLPVWRLSQWRIYHLFTFKNGKWKYLINPNAAIKEKSSGDFLFETGYLIRGSGKEIATPSGRKGFVRIKYQKQGVNALIKDTLVIPDYEDIPE